jgi:hypothetical protein
MLAITSACSHKNSNQELKTLNDIEHNIEAEGLSITSIDIPSELMSTEVENELTFPNPPIKGTNNNLYMIYYKKDSNTFEIENKILSVLGM